MKQKARLIKFADRYCNVMDYFNSGKKKYAAKYALQAYPVVQAIKQYANEHRNILFIELWHDIKFMRTSIMEPEYNVSWSNSQKEVEKVIGIL